MLPPYREVLAQPGALRFSLAGLFARLPISMLTLGVVLLVSGTGRSYALAGAGAGAVNLGFVIAGPRLGRLADRYGQATVLRPAALAQTTTVTALIVAGTRHAPGPVLVALGLLIGMSMPSVGGLVRARWSALLDSPSRLHTGFSFESVLDESRPAWARLHGFGVRNSQTRDRPQVPSAAGGLRSCRIFVSSQRTSAALIWCSVRPTGTST